MFNLQSLPYEKNALEPIISENTINFHYNKHHQGYVDKLNNLVSGSSLEGLSLEEIIIKTKDQKESQAIYNNAAQVYNHDFFWNSLNSVGSDSNTPSPSFKATIADNFSSWEDFIAEFKNAALTQFGSGWAWLVKDENDKLKIVKTANAENPLGTEFAPLLVVDVWEHAYYLDYQNKRADFLDQLLASLINWEKIEQRLLKK